LRVPQVLLHHGNRPRAHYRRLWEQVSSEGKERITALRPVCLVWRGGQRNQLWMFVTLKLSTSRFFQIPP
jgi:hypothetical protein